MVDERQLATLVAAWHVSVRAGRPLRRKAVVHARLKRDEAFRLHEIAESCAARTLIIGVNINCKVGHVSDTNSHINIEITSNYQVVSTRSPAAQKRKIGEVVEEFSKLITETTKAQ